MLGAVLVYNADFSWHDDEIDRARSNVVIVIYPFAGGNAFQAYRRGIGDLRFFRSRGVTCFLCRTVLTFSEPVYNKGRQDVQDHFSCFQRVVGPAFLRRP